MKLNYKLEVYIPEEHLTKVKNALFKAGAGKIGDYDCCCWQSKGEGQFRALNGANPYLGEIGETEYVVEYKVELICDGKCIDNVIKALINSHPYETPAYSYWKVNTD